MNKRIHYATSHYISHRTAGLANMRALELAGVALEDAPRNAEVIIVHDDPFHYPDWARRFPGKTLIAYCVWEANLLPEAYRDNLTGFKRIWTCSDYSAAAFATAGLGNVDVVPHVVEPPEPSREETEQIRQLLNHDSGLHYFYTVCDTRNPRKNFPALLNAFALVFSRHPDTRLVVKQYHSEVGLQTLPGVLSITDHLSPGAMAALHRVCDSYVSAHCAEAWGLSIADAMSAGNPVIATGYSGNMHYMDRFNSFPVKFGIVPVNERMREMLPHFTARMSWAEVDVEHLAYVMGKVSHERFAPEITTAAKNDMKRFAPQVVGKRMRALLDGL